MPNVAVSRRGSSPTRVFSLLCLFACWGAVARAQADGASDKRTDAASASTASEHANAPTTPELERARVQFQRGVELAARGDYANAAKRFREAMAIHPAPAVAYNLASALFELNQPAEAYNLVQSVLTASDTPEAVRPRAQQLEHALAERVARLTVVVGSEHGDVSIQVDGAELPPSQIGVPRAVEPGRHVVRAERGGVRVSEREVDIPLRTAALVDVSLVATPRQAAEATLAGTAPGGLAGSEADGLDDRRAKRWRRAWWIAGASALAVGAGVTLGILLARRDGGTPKPVAGDANPAVLVWK